MKRFDSAETAVEYVQNLDSSASTFSLDIADGITFAGRPDSMGAGMTILVDAVLAKGFSPDGFEQKDGYRVYRYKKEQ